MNSLKEISNDIWIFDGEEVSWYGMPYSTRMTVIRLKNGNLWVHSPEKIVTGLLKEINALGVVKYLVSPNKIHHLFVADWIQEYPDAISFSSPGLREKRSDLSFARDLGESPEVEWQDEIDQLIFKGSRAMEEVVFFHRKSETLILTDLIENFCPSHFKGFKKLIAMATGIVSPNGKTPLDWRLSFYFDKNTARRCLDEIFKWKPKTIIISHGECVYENAQEFLRNSFRWLDRNEH